MTLTQTERGYPPAVEHIGKPIYIKNEMGRLGFVSCVHVHVHAIRPASASLLESNSGKNDRSRIILNVSKETLHITDFREQIILF